MNGSIGTYTFLVLGCVYGILNRGDVVREVEVSQEVHSHVFWINNVQFYLRHRLWFLLRFSKETGVYTL